MDELLAKYMMGEATPSEMEMVAKWVEESDYNGKYFADFKLIWETSKTLKIESNLDVDVSWAEFKQLTTHSEEQLEEPAAQFLMENSSAENRKGLGVSVKLNRYKSWISIAAIWISIIGIAGFLYNFLHPATPQLLTLQTFNTVKTDTLSDGSVITLNKNTVLNYPEKFIGDTREIRLVSGEAFFSIAHNRSKPFLVHLNGAMVKVVGTSFNIRNNKDKAEIIVETGIVEVIRKKVLIRLKPTEKADIDYNTGNLTKGGIKDNFYNYYRTKIFIANKTPLRRVAEVLNAVYKVNIQIPDQALANRTLTTTLRLGALEPILKIIESTFNVRIVQQPGLIMIK